MKSVGVRELKQNASRVMAQVENGESFVVTVQGGEVGRIVPAVRTTWVSADQMMAVYDVPVDAGFWPTSTKRGIRPFKTTPGNGSESDSGYVRAAGGRVR